MSQKVLNSLFPILFSLTLSSCLFTSTTPESLNIKIDNWLTNNEFDKIDDTLDSLNSSDPEFKDTIKTKASIKEKRLAYIKYTSKKARKLQRENEWQAALNIYDDALNNIENEHQLVKERKSLISLRNAQVTKLKVDILLKNASALISYKKTYAKLKQLIPNDYSANFDINRYRKDVSNAVRELNLYGKEFEKNNQFKQAKKCYSLSNQLFKTRKKTLIVLNLTEIIAVSSNKKQQEQLLEAYDIAYEKHEYHNAKKHLMTLLKTNPHHVGANNKLRNLDDKIDNWVQKRTRIGKELYSQKKISAALKLWKNALSLEPKNNELIQLISRAEKVSQKMKTLEPSK